MFPRGIVVVALAVVALLLLTSGGAASAKPLGEQDPAAPGMGGPVVAFARQPPQGYEPYGNTQALDEDGTLDTALANYLFAKQLLQRLRTPSEVSRETQRKRSYWKQCAFNAVSCFGKRK
ncbi:uncharacterized protein LOC127009943 [Eriocheir sinensis]|uniref:uncharacterized protein LOC127009943 n=1 Tax=Eriocheir sinensis TaxID=95602 RepID=UPI0021C5F29B|nr:uncharacterized protein LOC127009943 [Eriocheir sinensis]